MLEIKVNIEAQDLSQAITQLALAIKGDVVTVPGQPELVIPAGTPMEVTAVNTAPQETAPAQAEVPQNTAQAPAQTAQAPVQQPAMNPPTAPALDLDTISRAGAALVDQGKMQEILAVLQKYGVLAVNQLRSDQYPAFAEDLRTLGAAI